MADAATATTAWSPHYTEPDVVDVRGLPVAYRRKGTGPPTLFLHGAGSTRMWLPFYGRMSQALDFIARAAPSTSVGKPGNGGSKLGMTSCPLRTIASSSCTSAPETPHAAWKFAGDVDARAAP